MANKNMKIAFLGIGQAGGNICDVASINGYNAAIMNTSQEDLDSIESIQSNYKLLIGNNGGAGKDRGLAKSDVKLDYKKIISFVKECFASSDIKMIYVVFSTAGGTGSGMSPIIIDLLKKSIPNKTFGAIAVLPSFKESTVSLVNCINCIKEVFSLSIPTFIVDNNKFIDEELSKKEHYDRINTKIIDNFNLLFKTNRKVNSKYGNLDNKDLLELITTPGLCVISSAKFINSAIINNVSFGKEINESWNDNIYAELEFDKIIAREGFIFEIDNNLTKYIDYDVINKNIGTPLKIFEGYYLNTGVISDNTVISILSGLSFPEKYLNKYTEAITQYKNIIKENRNKDNILDDEDTTWFDDVLSEKTIKSKISSKINISSDDEDEVSLDDIDLDDILNKY